MTVAMPTPEPPAPTEIAIVGMACRFPGAPTVADFWRVLRDGVEVATEFTEAELLDRGVPPDLVANPSYVRRGLVLDGIEDFDAALFGYAPQEAALLDPQNRLFLECAWEALESAGHGGERQGIDVGVFAGAGVNTYFLNNLAGNTEILERFGTFQVMLGNDKDYLSTLVSYKLNLTGPSVTVQTACSTSLVAVHMACQSLLNGECDMALAGGVALSTPQDQGYLHQDGMILSPDGHCRPFDAQAAGTLNGAGVGVVVLQPLSQALASGATILGIIKGSAVNNDGARKVGYTAPGPEGQTRVIAEALDIAGVHPDQVGYVEAHGTATPLGDPIEIAALTRAYRTRTDRVGFCPVGSLKSNMGHAGAAAGIAGVIKATLCLTNGQIPPTLHFQSPNPAIPLAGSPFFVNNQLLDWDGEPGSRVAAVSSFGIGGTNAHLVVAENRFAAQRTVSEDRRWRIVPLSGHGPEAVAAMTGRLTACLASDSPDVADVAWTLQTGRKAFAHRLAVIGRDASELRQVLETAPAPRVARQGRGVAFLLTGHGGQSAGMTRRLCETEPVFRDELSRLAAALAGQTGLDALAILHPAPGRADWAEQQLERMEVSQPLMFIVQMALARLWESWGIAPQTVIGHSSGEYAAACLARILSEGDALTLVAARGRLMDQTAPGGMVVLRNSESEVRPLLNERLSLAVVNADDLCVVSGHADALEAFEVRLAGIGVETRRLRVSRAAHSCTMDTILPAFAKVAATVTFHPPRLPYISGMTGALADASTVSQPEYWVRHLRETVRFADGIGRLMEDPDLALLEVGPGNALGTFARAHPVFDPARPVAATLPHPRQEDEEEDELAARSLARLWQSGVPIDWEAIDRNARNPGETRRKLALPTYPFQRRRCWIDPPEAVLHRKATPPRRKADPADWFLTPVWHRTAPLPVGNAPASLVLFTSPDGLGDALATRLKAAGTDVLRVHPGVQFTEPADGVATIRPEAADDYRRLFTGLGTIPKDVVHAWALIQPVESMDDARSAEERRLGFHSLCLLAGALDGSAHDITILASGLHDVTGDEPLCPDKTLICGPAMVIPQELPALRTHLIDLVVPEPGSPREARLLDQLVAELDAADRPPRICLRGIHRWRPDYEPRRIETGGPQQRALRHQGVYLITGGLGGLGLEIAGHLAVAAQARLALVGRSAMPPRSGWQDWIAGHDAGDPTRRVLERLLAFEAAGAQIRLYRANAGAVEDMTAVFQTVEAEWGPINGVVHAAGAIGQSIHQPLDAYDPAQSAEQFLPKLDGVRVLDRLLRDRDVDFCVLMSSMASILGGLGFAAYAAANAVLDTAAQKAERDHPGRWLAMNWDSWRVTADDGRGPGQILRALEMTAEEGMGAFLRILHHTTAAQTLVTRGDLAPRLRQWIDLPPREEVILPGLPVLSDETDVQAGVIGIWQLLLGHEQIGPDDSFFDLGGHSLLATQVLAQVRHRYNVAIPMSVLFRTPTARALAATIEAAITAAQTTTPAGAEPDAQPDGPHRPADTMPVLSWPQQQLWVLERVSPGTAAWNVPLALRLSGSLDISALERALNDIVRRHEALRTRFPARDGLPCPELLPPSPLLLPVVSLRSASGPALTLAERKLLDTEASRPFDLETGPLVRACLIESGSDNHILLVVMHHIITDGWSLAIFMKELVTTYEAFTRGHPSPWTEPAACYSDFSHWQRSPRGSENAAQQLAYWQERLAGLPERHGLLGDFALPEERSFASAVVTLPLGRDLTRRIHALAKADGATVFMLLLAAFHTLLFRYTGVNDQAVAVSVANRTRHWQEEIFGFFVNTIVLRAELQPDASFRALLAEVRTTTLDDFANQDLPFGQLVEALRPRRHTNQHPLAQIGFVLQNLPYENHAPEGLEITFVEAAKDACQFDLLCSVTEAEDDLILSLEYATELFQADSIERMAGHYRNLLDHAVEAPDTPLANLALLPADELQDILQVWSREPAPSPDTTVSLLLPPPTPVRTIIDLFDGIAARQPDAIAVSFGDRQLRYSELRDAANRISHAVAGLCDDSGVREDESAVCVSMPRGPELVAAFLGVLKAGKVYAPLDPATPVARRIAIMDDLRQPIVLSADAVCAILSNPPAPAPAAEPGSDALAYIIHTSGSTGKPKGAMLTHGGLLALAMEQRRLLDIGPGSRVLQLASASFDASVWEFVMALCSGAELVMAPADELMPGPDLARLLDERAITHLTITPPALAALPVNPLPALRVLVTAGAELPGDLAMRWLQNGCRVINAYGPTEATVCTTLTVCDGDTTKPLIGRPLDGWTVFVLDTWGNPVPAGVAGQLHIGGVGLARGYWDRPDLTATSFADHPVIGGRLYATGDRAVFRRTAEGAGAALEFLGRIDEQVKPRGFRVEPGEVEVHLRHHPDVAQAAVIGYPQRNPITLAAYLVLRPGAAVAGLASRLRGDLAAVLPDYMIPGYFVPVEDLPLNTSGKLDRSRLPDPRDLAADDAGRLPRDGLEAALCAVWEAVLGIAPISATTNVFDAGATSLQAIEIMARIEERFGVTLPVAALFRHPTVEALTEPLAALLSGEKAEDLWSPLVLLAGPAAGSTDRSPCFWFPGASGNVVSLAPLARQLGPAQPVYALQPVGLDGVAPPAPTIEAMTTRAVRAIRDVQPVGPYWLGGHSFGAKLAFAVARQLLHEGDGVALLTVIDGLAPGPNPMTDAAKYGDADWLALTVQELAATSGSPLPVTADRFTGRSADDALDVALSLMRDHGLTAIGRSHLRGMVRVMQACAVMDYDPVEVPPVRLLLLRAAQTLAHPDRQHLPPRLAGDDLGWASYSDGPLVARTLAADHGSILADPAARTIAALWREMAEEQFCEVGK